MPNLSIVKYYNFYDLTTTQLIDFKKYLSHFMNIIPEGILDNKGTMREFTKSLTKNVQLQLFLCSTYLISAFFQPQNWIIQRSS
jgi:hypothetical protein